MARSKYCVNRTLISGKIMPTGAYANAINIRKKSGIMQFVFRVLYFKGAREGLFKNPWDACRRQSDCPGGLCLVFSGFRNDC